MDIKNEPSTITEEEENEAVGAIVNTQVEAQEEYQDSYQDFQEVEEVDIVEVENPDEDEEESFDCKYCEFQTKNIEELDEHIIGHEEIEDEEESVFPEPGEDGGDGDPPRDPLQVQETSENGADLIPQVHQEYPSFYEEFKNKPIKNIFACPFCGYQSMKKLDMNQHIRDHRSPVELPVYSCSECYYTTVRKFDMPKHLLTHCDNYPKYECKQCPYSTKRKSDLNKHVLGHATRSHDKVLFPCHVCSFATTRQGDLKKHFLTHKINNSQLIFNCTECGYSAKRLNDLNKHVALHCDRSVEGILKCPKCEYATLKASPFARHVLSQCKSKEFPSYIYVTEQSIDEGNVVVEDIGTHNGSEIEGGAENIITSRKRKLPQYFEEYIVEEEHEARNEVEIVEENYHTEEVVVMEGFVDT